MSESESLRAWRETRLLAGSPVARLAGWLVGKA